jgi:hypothetical protein
MRALFPPTTLSPLHAGARPGARGPGRLVSRQSPPQRSLLEGTGTNSRRQRLSGRSWGHWPRAGPPASQGRRPRPSLGAAGLGARHVQLFGQRLSAPLGLGLGTGRGFLQLRRDSLPCLGGVIRRGAAAPLEAAGPPNPLINVPAPPFARGWRCDPQFFAHDCVAQRFGKIIILAFPGLLTSYSAAGRQALMMSNYSRLHIGYPTPRGVWQPPNATHSKIYPKLSRARVRFSSRHSNTGAENRSVISQRPSTGNGHLSHVLKLLSAAQPGGIRGQRWFVSPVAAARVQVAGAGQKCAEKKPKKAAHRPAAAIFSPGARLEAVRAEFKTPSRVRIREI